MSGFKRYSKSTAILFLIVIFQVTGPSMARPLPKANSQGGNTTAVSAGVTIPVDINGNAIATSGQAFVTGSDDGSGTFDVSASASANLRGILDGTGAGVTLAATDNGLAAAVQSGILALNGGLEIDGVTAFAT
ncbi:uncharacterized protein LOC129803934 [Phlebotomus papatasi]|uniref:uncharacterized protein LOC129803934 n=1 Tax=Phlebotomus papatasi TaxID=29031 RepID=UPI00248454BE|nr:uncharacterized protein LOC129803934 [Phlebotomus papatasi]